MHSNPAIDVCISACREAVDLVQQINERKVTLREIDLHLIANSLSHMVESRALLRELDERIR